MEYKIIGKDEKESMIFVQILTYSNPSRRELQEIALKIKTDSNYDNYTKFKFVNLNLAKMIVIL